MTLRTNKPHEHAGIWIDQKTAYVIKVSADHSPIVEKIDSGIMAPSTPANDEPFLRLAHSDPNKHDKIQQHNQHGLHTFFREVMQRLSNVDFVYIFGPGEAKHGLNSEIAREGIHFRCKVAGIEASDRITENQMRQKVIEFFTSLRFEDMVRKLSVAGTDRSHI